MLSWIVVLVSKYCQLKYLKLKTDFSDTDIPWPGPNVCENMIDPNQDITLDPKDCQCYYLCSGEQIRGHECCPNGLVFNPEILNCDWPFNVPNCNV